MNYRDWHVGMKVVCVPAPPARWRKGLVNTPSGERLPRKGEVYTIRALVMLGDILFVYLSEITNEPKAYTLPGGAIRVIECPFEARYFRPIQARKTDISIFTAMLNPAKQKVGA